MIDEALWTRAHEVAVATRERAHAPYSKFRVGAALITRASTVVGGCNVENASYGATVCAERIAMFRAVAEGGERGFPGIVIVAEASSTVVPCAMCLQVMAELCDPELVLALGDTKGIREKVRLADLLPRPFRPDSLQQRK